MARAAAAVRAYRRRHPRPRAGVARWPSGCAGSARRGSRRRRSARSRSRSRCPPVRDYDLLCVTSPAGADQLFTHLRDARELGGRDGGGDRAGHGAGAARARRRSRRRARAGRRRGAVEALAEFGSRACSSRGRARAATCCRTRCGAGRAGGGRRAVRDGGGAAVGRAREAAAAADYLLFTSGSSVRFFAEAGGSLSGPKLVSIGPGDHVGRPARARRRAGPRSRPAHARRADRGAARETTAP